MVTATSNPKAVRAHSAGDQTIRRFSAILEEQPNLTLLLLVQDATGLRLAGIEVADVAKVLRRRWDCGLRIDCAVGCADILDLASAKRSRNQKQEKSRSHVANAQIKQTH